VATTTYTSDPWERKETLWLLELHIALLPNIPKRILALYYFENARPSQIAVCFGLTESEIIRIRTETVTALREELLSFMGLPQNLLECAGPLGGGSRATRNGL
jgi:DNA-directed RNA polymerase specialized sigma subunit